jgi:hypothetical protein
MRKRSYAAFSAAVIAVALVLLYATAASGGRGGGPRVVTFTTVDSITSFKAFDPAGAPANPIQPHAGDTIVATADSKMGKTKVGENVTHCQMVTDTKAQCQGTWQLNGKGGLRRGSLTAAGVLTFGSQEVSKAPIVGGTGHVRGARGEIVRTTVAPGQDRVRFKVLDE